MEFEIGHLDMLISNDHAPTSHRPGPAAISGSLILNELQKEAEDLQCKLKLNNRRLLLFETENTKLIEEKNKLFFEMQNTMEKHQLIVEKIIHLEGENTDLLQTNEELREKNKATTAINQTQLSELKRFTKFHLKIQNVIKPYIQQLKTSNESLETNLNEQKIQIHSLTAQNYQLIQRLKSESEFFTNKINSMEMDKNQTITSYEEQIHSFSNEINRLQQQNEDYNKEIGRLKKAIEFKNYFENELIKFKRIHEDDQREMNLLSDKLNRSVVQVAEKEQLLSVQMDQLKSTESNLRSVENVLESTRQQLSKQIDHATTLSERLSRLEKLNLSLSQQMQPETTKT